MGDVKWAQTENMSNETRYESRTTVWVHTENNVGRKY